MRHRSWGRPDKVSHPGVYIEEVPSGIHAIEGVSTSIAAFVGRCSRGPTDGPTLVGSFAEFVQLFGQISQLAVPC
jgi:uncharacterized protein